MQAGLSRASFIDVGHGMPVVVIPGIQGRWEWMAPAIDALRPHARVLTHSLADEPSSRYPADPARGFANYVSQLRDTLDAADLERAVIVGISYGGLVAAEFAARHPDRVQGLMLVSALAPDWSPDARARFYLRAPRLLSPMFALSSPLRLLPEVWAAFGSLPAVLRFALSQAWCVLRAPMSPARMARRIGWALAHSFGTLPHDVPALIVTGEPGLDLVVPTTITTRYLERLPQARLETLARTGHLGIVTRPEAFAAIVTRFLRDDVAASAAQHRRAG